MNKQHLTMHEALRAITTQLLPVYPTPTAALQAAWLILERVTKLTRTALLVHNQVLSKDQEQEITNIINEITVEHKPLDYILGTVPFLDLTLTITPPILIPRQETAWWCFELLKKLSETNPSPHHILDIGTGSGCLALSIGKSLPESIIDAVDISETALKLAHFNREENHVSNVNFVYSNLFDQLPDTPVYDLIVSNPPYIDEDDWKQLDPSVKRWEDKGALVAEENGYALIAKIIEQAPRYLSNNGQLWIEIGAAQGAHVQALFTKFGFTQVTLLQDLYGRDRVVHGVWNKP